MKKYLNFSLVFIALVSISLGSMAQEKTTEKQLSTVQDREALENAPRIIPVILGSGRQTDSKDFIRCTNTKFAASGYGVVIRFNFGRTSGGIIGSWTVRLVVGSDPARHTPETVASYYFDGVFTSGEFDPGSGTSRNFDLRGTTTYAMGTCRTEDQVNGWSRQYNVRIWGTCGNNTINFEVTDPNTGAIYSTSTFNTETEVTCGSFSSTTVSGTLNSH